MIFGKKKLEEVQTALINHAKTSTEEPQPAKYVQEHRELSESIVIEVAEQLQKVKHYTEQEIYSNLLS